MGDISKEISCNVNLINDLPTNLVKTFSEAAFASLQKHSQSDTDILLGIHNQHQIPFIQVCDTFGLFIKIIRYYMQNSTDQFHSEMVKIGLKNELIEELPQQFAGPVSNVISTKKLVSIKWRVDISVNKEINRKRPATIIMKLQFVNKSFIIILSLKSLDLLRNNISTILNEIFKFKKLNITKNK